MFFPLRAPTADVSNAKYLAHLAHQTQKNLPLDVVYVPKLYHLCPYRCKFAMIQTQMLNQNIVFYSAFSLLSLLVLVFSLFSHIKPSSSLNRERTKWHIPHLQTISSKARWPLSPEVQVAWARPLRSLPSSSPLRSCWSLSLFWWLVDFGWWWEVDWVVGVRFGMCMRFGMVSDRVVGCGSEIVLWVWDLWLWSVEGSH